MHKSSQRARGHASVNHIHGGGGRNSVNEAALANFHEVVLLESVNDGEFRVNRQYKTSYKFQFAELLVERLMLQENILQQQNFVQNCRLNLLLC